MSSTEKKKIMSSLVPHRQISQVLIYKELRGFVSYFQKLMKQMLWVFYPLPLRPFFHFLFLVCFHSQQPASVFLWRRAFISSEKIITQPGGKHLSKQSLLSWLFSSFHLLLFLTGDHKLLLFPQACPFARGFAASIKGKSLFLYPLNLDLLWLTLAKKIPAKVIQGET